MNADAFDTGERIEIVGVRGRLQPIRQLDKSENASEDAGLIDALAFTVKPSAQMGHEWLINQMRQFMPVDHLEPRKGWNGYKSSLGFGDGEGLIAWGGVNQRGTVYFSLMGQGCGAVKDWIGLHGWLAVNKANLKRVDVAHDDFSGEKINIEWARQQYLADGFNAGGRKPKHCVHGDFYDGDHSVFGRTLYIGNRQSGKFARCYEKGKQLGDPDCKWTRFEVEWHGKDRVIPYDILLSQENILLVRILALHFCALNNRALKQLKKPQPYRMNDA